MTRRGDAFSCITFHQSHRVTEAAVAWQVRKLHLAIELLGYFVLLVTRAVFDLFK